MTWRALARRLTWGHWPPAQQEGVNWFQTRVPGKGRPRVVMATVLGVLVAGVLVVLVLQGLKLPLALFLPVTIVLGVTLMFANWFYAALRPSPRAGVSTGSVNGDRNRWRWWFSRVLLSVGLAFIGAECATMVIYDGPIDDRVNASIDGHYLPAVTAAMSSVADLQQQAAIMSKAVNLNVGDDPVVAMYQKRADDMNKRLQSLPDLPCGAARQCPSRLQGPAMERDYLTTQLNMIGPLMEGARESFRVDHKDLAGQLGVVNDHLADARVVLSKANAEYAAARQSAQISERIDALVVLGDQQTPISLIVPTALFLLGLVLDYGILARISRGKSI